jgi:hypothetical protein
VTNRHRLAATLADHIPDGFQLEIRHDDEWHVTTFRYLRIADEVWCQHTIADMLIENAVNSIDAIADGILEQVARTFREHDALGCSL